MRIRLFVQEETKEGCGRTVGPPAQDLQESRILEPGSLVPRPGKFYLIALEPDSGGLIWEASPFPPVVGSARQ